MIKFRTLRADEVDARVGTCNEKGFSLLLYKDARCDQNILDETVGAEEWQRKHYEVKGNMFCSVGIFSEDRKEWIWKDDCGTESNTEKEKGEASDSFKRACFNWGIGRELYTAPFIYIQGKTEKNPKGQWIPSFKSFTVNVLEVENGKISKLQISGYEKGEGTAIIFEFGMKSASKKQTEEPKTQSSDKPNNENDNNNKMTLEQAYGLKTQKGIPFRDLTLEQLDFIIENGGAKSREAAKLIKEDMQRSELKPIDEDNLPF